MRELIAGDGGSVLVAASVRQASALACEGLAASTTAPNGTPVHPADRLPDDLDVDAVRLLPCESSTQTTIRAWATARGIPVIEDAEPVLDAPAGVRVVSVSSATTGSGKTALTRRLARTLSRSGVSVAVARHPIANLLLWDRFRSTVIRDPRALSTPRPLEECEELAPVVGAGIGVVTGLDAASILNLAAHEAGPGGVVVWDGGGAAVPWVASEFDYFVIDLLRPPPAGSAERIAAAHVVVLTKADTAPEGNAREMEAFVREHNRDARIVLADLAIGVSAGQQLTDKAAVVVEDWASLALGGLIAGAGAVAARRFRCGVVDPRPFAVDAIATALREHAHIGAVIPSLGRTPTEIADLAASVAATPGEVVLWASNADPSIVIGDETRPVIRAFGELTEVAGPSLQELVSPLLPGQV